MADIKSEYPAGLRSESLADFELECMADFIGVRSEGHNSAFDYFDGVPQSILYDNTKIAVAKIVKGGKRLRSQMFAELQSHYLFADRFGRPGKGNDKGKNASSDQNHGGPPRRPPAGSQVQCASQQHSTEGRYWVRTTTASL